MTWRPIVEDDAERARYLAIAAEIAVAVAAYPVEATTDHQCDHAILRAYLGCDEGSDDDVGAAALSAAVSSLGSTASGPALHGGAARVAWAVAHLTEGDDADAVGTAVEGSLVALLERPDWLDYDLISGLVGFGVLALECGDARGALAGRVLDHLERLAEPRGAGLAWFSPPSVLPDWQRAMCPDGYWNLGLAHGIPGVIGLLARYLAVGIEPARARRLLDGAVAHLLAAAPPRDDGRFAAWIPRNHTEKHSVRRVAWCYGDLGVATALLAAAEATGEVTWRAEALATAHLAARCPAEQSGVIDPGICHGAAGAAHLFNRMYQATGDAELGDAARAWLARTVAMRRDGDVAGFPSAIIEEGAKRWTPDVSLLTGAPGVALVLAAACSEVEPLWDRLLLADFAC